MAKPARTANEERGEVNLFVDDKTPPYVLRMTNQAICEAQAATGRTWGQLILGMNSVDYIAYRAVLHVMLKPYYAQEFEKLTAVSALIDRATIARVSDALGRLFALNAAQEKRIEDEIAAAKNPTDAATSSTGEPPISTRDDSD